MATVFLIFMLYKLTLYQGSSSAAQDSGVADAAIALTQVRQGQGAMENPGPWESPRLNLLIDILERILKKERGPGTDLENEIFLVCRNNLEDMKALYDKLKHSEDQRRAQMTTMLASAERSITRATDLTEMIERMKPEDVEKLAREKIKQM
ncbi:hypothetical protein ACLMJK_007702 [Lecanora helva]